MPAIPLRHRVLNRWGACLVQGLEDHEVGEINGLMVGDTEKVVGFVRMFNQLAMVPISFAILFSYIFTYFKAQTERPAHDTLWCLNL